MSALTLLLFSSSLFSEKPHNWDLLYGKSENPSDILQLLELLKPQQISTILSVHQRAFEKHLDIAKLVHKFYRICCDFLLGPSLCLVDCTLSCSNLESWLSENKSFTPLVITGITVGLITAVSLKSVHFCWWFLNLACWAILKCWAHLLTLYEY